MRCKYIPISHPGASAVDQLFILEKDATVSNKRNLIVPDCTPGLMLIEKGNFWRKLGNQTSHFKEGQLVLFGQKTLSAEYFYEAAELKAIGYKLMPHTLYSLFGISAHELTNKSIELKDINHNAQKILDDLRNEKIETSLDAALDVPPLLEFILSEIHEKKGDVSIKQLVDLNKVGYKRIERLFKLYIGITPKLYTRIIRFNHSFRISSQRSNTLTDIAFQSGFFDQNHFIKESKHFTGFAPSHIYDKESNLLEKDHLAYLKSRSF